MMKVTTLIENTTDNNEFYREHGLSLLIETKGKNILFDSGQSGRFIDNAENLGIDLKVIDYVILSHGHYDHGGGLKRFIKLNKDAKIYMNEHAFEDHFHNESKYIGLDKNLKDSNRIIFTKDNLQLEEGINLTTCNNKLTKYPIDTSHLFKRINNSFIPEDFNHEQYLEIIEDGRKVLFSGCSHKGILNIMNWFKPDVLIGGFHFMEIDLDEIGKEKLRRAAQELIEYKTVYYTGHCTGRKQFNYLKSIMGDKLHSISTGDIINI